MPYHHTQTRWAIIISLILSAGFAAPLLTLSGQDRRIPIIVAIIAITGSVFPILTIEGIHLTLCGWLYNVSGFNAVEITLKS